MVFKSVPKRTFLVHYTKSKQGSVSINLNDGHNCYLSTFRLAKLFQYFIIATS